MRTNAGKEQSIGSKRNIAITVLLAAAAGLLVIAFAWPKEDAPPGWEPLNLHVEAALSEEPAHYAENDGTGADPGNADEAESKKEGTSKGSSEEAAGEQDAAELLDINRASAEQLDGLKGIGPAKAKAIVADREQNGFFKSTDDLLRVKGIGPKMLAGLKENIVARP